MNRMGVERGPSESGGSLRLELEVPPIPGSLSEVRRAFGALELPAPLLDDVRLLVNELVTNSIRHAGLGRGDMIRVRAWITGRILRVEVLDRNRAVSDAVAGSIRPPPGAESGWGLYLVGSIADRWGHASGRFWFEVELRT